MPMTTVLYMAVSLDGYVAGHDDDISWLMPYADVEYGFDDFFSTVGAIVQGRRAYDEEIKHGWEHAHPVPTFVLTHAPPDRAPERSDVFFTDDDIAAVLRRIGSDVTDRRVWIEGGARVAQQFLRRGLLDAMILSVAPVLLGDGIRLFDPPGGRLSLPLVDAQRFDKGLVQLHYGTPEATSA